MKIERYNQAKGFIYVPFTTGIEVLDERKAIGNNDFVIIAGRTGSGKSYLALWIALNIAKSGKRVLYINQETDAPEFCDRIDLMGFDFNNDFGERDENGRNNFIAVHSEDFQRRLTYQEIETWVQKLKPDLLVIDLFSSMIPPGVNIPVETEIMASKLKFFPSDYNCAVLATEQFGKDIRGHVRPDEDYVKGGKAICNWATKIFTLYEFYRANPDKAVHNKSELVSKTVEFMLVKDGHGKMGFSNIRLYRDFGFRCLFDTEKAEYDNVVFKKAK